jgi:hypothetical protein
MKTYQLTLLILAGSMSCFGQHWELGANAGAGFVPGKSITSASGPATAGFQPGVTFGAFVGQNLYRHLSGEVRYGFMQSNLRLQSNGQTATFSGNSHVLHYDMVYHTSREGARAQYYVAGGGGMKIYRGTGTESAYQPLSQYAYFTKTQTVKPMASVGAGIKFSLSPHVRLRTEIRDFMTMFPKEVITPAPGAKFGGMLHNIVPMVGISFEN